MAGWLQGAVSGPYRLQARGRLQDLLKCEYGQLPQRQPASAPSSPELLSIVSVLLWESNFLDRSAPTSMPRSQDWVSQVKSLIQRGYYEFVDRAACSGLALNSPVIIIVARVRR